MLAGNDNIHESLEEIDIRPDPNAGFHGNPTFTLCSRRPRQPRQSET